MDSSQGAVLDLSGRVAVLLPRAGPGFYDYRVPPGLAVAPGDFVRVPLGSAEVTGVVWGPARMPDLPDSKVRFLLSVLDLPPLPAPLRGFIDWMAGYTLSDPGAVLKLALPVDPLEAVEAKGRIKPLDPDSFNPDHRLVTLSPDQQAAADALTAAVRGGGYQALLLDGVTGAGKTEVYFEAIAQVLRDGRQALILLPEIALTQAFVARFTARFGAPPALWHSGLTPARRRATWKDVVTGRARVVAGARSALMLPYVDLSLLIVDEEHDAVYKQEDGVLYHARDMAVARAHHEAVPVVLVSATPSLETMVNVWAGRYKALALPDRFGGAQMPDIHLIDLRANAPERGSFLSPPLVQAMAAALAREEQALLFLNRRGYAPLTLCRSCGHRMMCPRCTAWLVEHRRSGRLHCHHCGYQERVPPVCPSCGEGEALTACGPGVERIEEEVKALFPLARTLILSSDLAEQPEALRAAILQVENHDVDIIVGTQIIAKGHHFPRLTCVGVVDADLGLAGGDLRAGERTFQLLQQVAGRAGRAERPGAVYLQTFRPEAPVMQALAGGRRDAFLQVEATERQAAHMPPYARLVALIVSGTDEAKTRSAAFALSRAAPEDPRLRVWGPAEAPLFRLRGKYRFRLLLQADRALNVQKGVAEWLARVKLPSGVVVRVDVDPQSFF